MQPEDCAMSFFNHGVEYGPIFYVTFFFFFFFVRASRHFYPVLNIACCAPFEELLCV